MPLVYVFAASRMEAGRLAWRAILPGASRGTLIARSEGQRANRILLTITGMGPANARSKAETAFKLVERRANGMPTVAGGPDAVLVIGVCGALIEALPEQTIVSPILASAILERLRREGMACDPVVGITSSRIASTKSERMALAQSGASVVDMESYEILSAAERAGAPAVALRVVSDSLDAPIPEFNRALKADGRIDKPRALWMALGSPLKMLRLLAANRRAIKQLSAAVKLALESKGFPA